jgi:hypothetical protein
MTKSKSVTEGEIPLYLLPRAIARQVTRFGDSVYRISVKRTHWHHYNISVRTKSLPKELMPCRVARLNTPGKREPEYPPMIHVHAGSYAV